MKLFIETSKKLLKCSLSKKVEDSFIFTFVSNKIEKRISLSSQDNEWYIVATPDYSII